MEFISHRINTLNQLTSLPDGHGAEIDLRTYNHSIILHHDLFKDGLLFNDFIKIWSEKSNRGTLILNTKEDGLEELILNKLQEFSIDNFFFLDTTIPTLVRLTKKGIKNFAIRISEYEGVSNAFYFADKVSWAWVDTFSGIPPTTSVLQILKNNFKICLVSPELPGHSKDLIHSFLPIKKYCDAICTKHADLWAEKTVNV